MLGALHFEWVSNQEASLCIEIFSTSHARLGQTPQVLKSGKHFCHYQNVFVFSVAHTQ